MDLNKDKIPSPFKAPEGYFDDFESRLASKISAKPGKTLSSSRGGRPIGEYLAIAATLAAILVTTWVVFFKAEQKDIPVAVQPPKSEVEPLLVPVLTDSAKAETLANRVVEEIMEQPENINPVGVSSEAMALNEREKAVARELEDAGLIVMDANDGLFDTFEL